MSILLVIIYKSKKKKLKDRKFKNNLFYYFLIIFLLIEWFYNHPSLRYGGYIIFALIIFMPLSYFLSNYEIPKNFRFKTIILFLLVTLIFIGRNIDRIIYEQDFYQANFKQNMFFFTDKKYFRIDNKLKDLFKIYNDCNPDYNKCSNNKDFIIKKGFEKMILISIRN